MRRVFTVLWAATWERHQQPPGRVLFDDEQSAAEHEAAMRESGESHCCIHSMLVDESGAA